jgi:hypothetical protein
MNKINILYLLIILLIPQNLFGQNCTIKSDNYRNYIDTIKIVDPIRLQIVENNLSISLYVRECDISKFKKMRLKSILKNENVFFYTDNPYSYIPINEFPGLENHEFRSWKKESARVMSAKPILNSEYFLKIRVPTECYNLKEGHSQFRRLNRAKIKIATIIFPIVKKKLIE